MPNIELIEDRVLVKKLAKPAGGLEIPEGTSTESGYLQGEVVGVGDCKTIKVGDVVYYKEGHSKILLDGEEYFIIREQYGVGRIKNHA
mgnify:CR=1 FL=1